MSVIKNLDFDLPSEKEATDFASKVALCFSNKNLFKQGVIVYLEGELGAGKSHFSRGFIQAFMPNQKVKSPTYTIIESYNFSTNSIYHLDLYRLCDPEELEYLALRDIFRDDFVALIEWPSKGEPILPSADVVFKFSYKDFADSTGRQVKVLANSTLGEQLLKSLNESIKNEA